MANVHVRMIEDAQGDLVDIEYFHHFCAVDLFDDTIKAWPAPEAVDYPVYCSHDECGIRIVDVPLTDFGMAEYGTETVRNDT